MNDLDIKVSAIRGKSETVRALRILLACQKCRPMAQALLDQADTLNPSRPIAIIPCPDCAEKYAGGPAH